MKKIITTSVVILMTANVFAQAPEKMSYQAVLRDGNNSLVTSTSVGMQISILQGSHNSTVVYTEIHTPTSNANGLVSIEIGGGTVVSGTFATIDWANGPYFIQTETDPTGGTNYTITGTSQLLSVPYALHSKTAESVTGSSYDFYIGQDTLGGIVFYIYFDQNGDQHGLIVNKNESSAQWQTNGTTTNANRSWDGVFNTSLMTGSPASTYVNALTDGGFTDWYLPSVDEISLLWHNRFHVNKTLSTFNFTLLSFSDYWTSTEFDDSNAMIFSFLKGGMPLLNNKTSNLSVRAIRSF